MNEKKNNPGKDQKAPIGTEHQNDELDIGNEMSVGSENGSKVSDFDPEKDYPETEEKEHRDEGDDTDDMRSDDNGINPSPDEIDPQKKTLNNDLNVENADQDELNPYPDEMKPDDDDERLNSTWMISGRNRKI